MSSTQERIFSIADQLSASGQIPTLAAVRQALGGGSYTTLQKAMREWKAQRAEKQAAPLEAAPPAVTECLTQTGAHLWNIALEAANASLSAERSELEHTRASLEAERNEASELANQLAGELDRLQARFEAMEHSLSAERTATAQAAQQAAAQQAASEATIAQMQKQLETQQKQAEGFNQTLLSQIESLLAQQKKRSA